MKRTTYLSWDEYFMAVALLSAQRSKDPNTQVGACVANEQNRIVGVGYNGFPAGCSDDVLPWDRQGPFLETKYPYVCHAELNAVLNAISTDLEIAEFMLAFFPATSAQK
jgi:dCMP deaminase